MVPSKQNSVLLGRIMCGKSQEEKDQQYIQEMEEEIEKLIPKILRQRARDVFNKAAGNIKQPGKGRMRSPPPPPESAAIQEWRTYWLRKDKQS